MKVAAAYADSWNTLDIRLAEYSAREYISAQKALESCRRRQEAFDACCVMLGRNPSDIRRSLLVGYAADVPTDSVDAFQEYVGRYREVGIDEFILIWLPDEYRDALAGRISGFDRNMVERVAVEAIPAWR